MLFGTGWRQRREGNGSSAEEAEPAGGSSQHSAPEAAVRAELERILNSPSFRYSERLRSFLKFVVDEGLAGNGDQLKESVLAVELFAREATYDSRADSVVRVEARRLREKLQKYYSAEGSGDPVVITLPKGGYAPVFSLREAPVESELPAKPARRPRQFSLKMLALVALASVLATVVLIRGLGPRSSSSSTAHRRITADPGLTFQPALSSDGTLVAYSSDRSGTGHLDIWVQQISGGLPVRLTDSPGDDIEPAFSPDGAMVAYRAEGEVAGIYVVPALGGTSTLLARGGYRPRYSPDGTKVAYWTGERSYQRAKVFIVPATGGSAVQIQPEFEYAADPVWSEDGSCIAFVGSRKLTNHWNAAADDWDWWVAPVQGGEAIRTFARTTFKEQRLQAPQTSWSHRRILPYHWTRSGKILFSARTGGKTNVWQIPVSARNGQAIGPAEQLTFGAGWEDHPAMAADGALAYSVLTYKADVWSLPIRADTAETREPMTRLTSDAADNIRPVVSQNGDRVAFISNRSGNYDIWARDLKTGREAALTATREDRSCRPTVRKSPTGTALR